MTMKAYILCGGRHTSEMAYLEKELMSVLKGKGWSVDIDHLKDHKIEHCKGCFGCWVNTPGECLIDDENREFARKFVNADLVVILTPVTFGGYSSYIKRSLDRFIPLVSPFFISIGGETHHRKRYRKYPDILVVGVADGKSPDEVNVFKKLVERNTINLHTRNWSVVVITSGDKFTERFIHRGLLEVGI